MNEPVLPGEDEQPQQQQLPFDSDLDAEDAGDDGDGEYVVPEDGGEDEKLINPFDFQPHDDQPPRRKRGRPPKRQPDLGRQPPGRPEGNSALAAADDLDVWGSRFDWQVPGMRMQLHRKSPPYEQGVKVAGYLESKDQASYTIDEIRNRFGGGDFEVVVIGPTGLNNPKPRALNRKRFTIGGRPIINQDNIPIELRDAAPGRVGGFPGMAQGRQMTGADPTAKALTEIVGGQLDALNRKVFHDENKTDQNANLLKNAYAEATKLAIAATQDKASAAASASEQVARMHAENARRAEAEAARLKVEHDELREKLHSMEADVAVKIQEASGNGIGLIAQLLPQFSTSAKDQVQSVISQYAAREERQAAQYQAQVNAIHQAHDTQMKMQGSQHEMQLKVVESNFNNTITLLKGQIQNLEAEKAHLQRQLDDARRLYEDARKDLMTNIMSAKQQPDTMEQFVKLAQLKDTMSELFGGGGASAGDAGDSLADGIENPMMRSLLKVGDKVLPHIPAILDTFKGRQQQMQQMYQQQPGQMPYPQQMMPPQQMMQPYPQSPQMMPQPMPPSPQPMPMVQPAVNMYAPQPEQPPKKKRALLKKEDVMPALQFLNTILAQPEPPAVTEIIQMALMQAPHDVLKALASREPEQVIANMEAAGMFAELNNLRDERGKAYAAALLLELRKHLG